NDVFAVGDYGTILHYDGSAWSPMTSGTTGELYGIWGTAGSDVFAVGGPGTILHYDGSTWSPMASGTTEYLLSVWGTSGGNVFAVGGGGTILHYDGSTWSPMTSGTITSLASVWGTSGSDVFAVGIGGTILHYDGSTWSPMSSGTTQPLLGIWGTAGSDVFAVGKNGAILHYDGSTWSPMTSGTTMLLKGIWGTSGSDVFAVGGGGTILHYDGSTWSPMTSGTTEILSGVWGASGSDVFAVAYSGIILHYDGSTWSPMTSGTTMLLLGVWGTAGSNVFAVGQSGTILHYDGSTWSPMASGTTEYLLSVWGASGNDVFAVGQSGTILHYDGNTWSPMTSGTTEHLYSVWGTAGSDVFAVTYSGTILHYDGSTWSPMTSGTTQPLLGIWGTAGSGVFAVGDYGTILYYCTYPITPENSSCPSDGGTGSVDVTAPAGGPWTAESNDAWITITAGASGTGNGTVQYLVASNTSSIPRTGTLTIAGETFTVDQEGIPCVYAVNPAGKLYDSSGGTGSVDVTTPADCPWTAVSNDAWITITAGSSGAGDGTVNYSVDVNGTARCRMGTMTIAGETFTVDQSGVNGGNWSDNFNGGSQQSWIVLDEGTESSATFVNNRYQLYTEGNDYTDWIGAGVNVSADDCTIQARVEKLSSEDCFAPVLSLRTSRSGLYFYATGVNDTYGNISIDIRKLGGGVFTLLAVQDDLTALDLSAPFYMKFSAEGNTLRSKAWNMGDPEPAEWMVEATDSDIPSGAGGVAMTAHVNCFVSQGAFDDVVFTVGPPPEPPVADAGPDQLVDQGVPVTLDGSNSSDPDGEIVSWQWTQTGGPPVTLSDPFDMNPTFIAPPVDVDGAALTFELTVTDDGELQASDVCIVNVSYVNLPPIADAGPDQTVDANAEVFLDGSSSHDPDGAIVSYHWEQTAGPSVLLSDIASATPVCTAPLYEDGANVLTFTLTVTDDGGLLGQDTCTITIRYNRPPATPRLTSPEDGAALDTRDLITLTAGPYDDPEGDAHVESRWSIRRIDHPACEYEITSSTDLTQHTITGLCAGLEYAWKVGYVDAGSGLVTWSNERTFFIGPPTVDTTVSVPSGAVSEDYRMVSFTVWPYDPEAASIFCTEPDTAMLRFAAYDPLLEAYHEYGDPDLVIRPGSSYWLLARVGYTPSVHGITVSLNVDIDVPLQYNEAAANGWNMIGPPNSASYRWEDVQVLEYDAGGTVIQGPTRIGDLPDENTMIDTRLWRWESGAYYADTTELEAHTGYWVKARTSNVWLRFPADAHMAENSITKFYVRQMMKETAKVVKAWGLTPAVAVAEVSDTPPPPPGGLTGGSAYFSSKDGEGGCFITTTEAP
ncbi:MAG: hypothetical protein JXO48_00910, partial [Deltaproteobacteria bacterium]|nr:hypothetical protein [Deltaproteobacteria bacterium]